MVSNPNDYSTPIQIEAPGFHMMSFKGELPLDTHEVYGIGCLLDKLANELEMQVKGGCRRGCSGTNC